MKNTVWTGVILLCCSVNSWGQCRAAPPPNGAQILAASSSGPTASFSVADRGAITFDTEGGAGSPMVGYARLQTSSGTTPSAYLTFQSKLNGILIGQASVGATAPILSGRIYAEVGGPVNTGVAIANPNGTGATVTYYFTDANGQNSPSASFPLAANAQTSVFLTEAPFNVGAFLNGTMTFSSSIPISVIALRSYLNERGESLITTLPVTNLTTSTSAGGTLYLPHFADGGGWKTQVVLVNPSDSATSGFVQFFSTGSGSVAGQPLNLTVEGQLGSTFTYSIPARSSVRLATAGLGGVIVPGSVRITSTAGTTPTALAIFTNHGSGFTVSEAGVPSVIPSTAFRMYEYDCGDYKGQIQTGVAITNPGATAVNVNIELTELWGAPAGFNVTIPVPANGQVARFLRELIPSLPYPFHGVARVSSSSPIAVTALRGDYNTRNDFLITTALPTSESAPANSADAIFPELVDLGGYTTSFVLYSGVAGQVSTGVLSFYARDGSPLPLNLD